MRALPNRLILVFGMLALLIALLVSCSTQIRIVRYAYPDIDDYKIFVNDTIKKGRNSFPIPVSKGLTDLIDTIQLRHPIHKSPIPLPDYLQQTNTKAFLIIQDDTLVYEKYFDGYSKSTIHGVFSVSKSIISVVAGVAMAEFPEMSATQPVTTFIPELKNKHPGFNKLTLNDLFAMKSGLSYSTYQSLLDVFCDNNMIYYTRNQKKYISKSDFQFMPGESRQYKAYDPILVAWIIENISRRKLSDYFSEKIWTKIGAEYDALWSTDEYSGLVKASSSFNCTAVDLAKIGLLYLKKGVCNGVEVVPKSWVETSVGVEKMRSKKAVIDTWWQPSQDYFWWFSTLEPLGDYYADGFKGQFLYVNPNTNTVIVKFSDVADELHDMPFRKIAERVAGRIKLKGN